MVDANSFKLAETIAQKASDKLAQDIVALDVSSNLAIADLFVIVTGANERHIKAIADEIASAVSKLGIHARSQEKSDNLDWILLDLVDVVVHIQKAQARDFYALESLWHDCDKYAYNELSRTLEIIGSESGANDEDEATIHDAAFEKVRRMRIVK